MEVNSLVSGEIINDMAMVFLPIIKEKPMKENGKMINLMDMECTKEMINIVVIGKMAKNREKAVKSTII